MSERIGSYEILRLLATGGMGELFLARSDGRATLASEVVVKRILRHLAKEKSFITMFLNEARLAAPLNHPNIVRIFELGEDQGTYFLVMEYVNGLSLHAIQRELQAKHKRLSPRLAAYICAQALHGLHYAHTLTDPDGKPLGIVHRDVTPDNLLVGFNGTVKIADFGIAKGSTNAPTTVAGTVKGKFGYMSPEQINGHKVDGRADVFSMGVVLYLMLAGQLPFDGPSDGAIVNAILNREPTPLAQLASPEVSPALVAVVHRALNKDPAQRFSNAQAMAFALESMLARESERVNPQLLSTFLRAHLPDPLTAPPPTAAQAPTAPGSSSGSADKPTMVERITGQTPLSVKPPTPISSLPPTPPPRKPPSAPPPSVVVTPPAPVTPAPAEIPVLIAEVERSPVADAQKRTRVPLADRIEAFRPVMSLDVTRDFERDFKTILDMEEYSPMEANRAIDYLCARCLPQMQLSQARKWAGRGFLMRYRMSILGRVLLAAMPFLGVERLVQRSPREFAATTNYGTRRVFRLAPGKVRYDFLDEVTHAEFIEGILWAGGEISRAQGLTIDFVRQAPGSFSFHLAWRPS